MSANPYAASRVMLQAKWFAIAKVGIAIVSLLTQLVLVRHLTVDDYASYTILVAGTGVLVFLTMFGMDRVIYRFLPPLREAMRWREALALMAGMLSARLLLMVALLAVLLGFASIVLPAQIVHQLREIPWQCALYALGQACTDSLLIFCNSVGLQRKQAMLFMLAGAVRLVAVFSIMVVGPLTAIDVANVFAYTEFGLAAAMALVLAREFHKLRRAAGAQQGWQFGFSFAQLWRDSLGTQAAYMLGLPFKGALLKLIVGAVSTPLVTAAFGFFQTMADRAYQFMPVFLLKGMIEPALASDYAARKSIDRVRLTVSLLLRFNFLIIFLGIAILAGSGEGLIDWITKGRYGEQVLLAILISVQLTGMTLGESLFFALNPVGRVGYHNRVWMRFALPFLGMLALAAWLGNTYLLVAAATLPYYVVYAWLRWVHREESLAHGLGVGVAVIGRLLAAAVAGALAGRAILYSLPAGLAATLAATVGVAIVFMVALRVTGLFRSSEVDSVRGISPKLAQLLHPFSAA